MATRLRLSASSHSTADHVDQLDAPSAAASSSGSLTSAKTSLKALIVPEVRASGTTSAPFMHRALFSPRGRKRILQCSVKFLLVGLVFLYGVVPLGIYIFPGILKSLIFLTFVQKPLLVNYSDPEASGLPSTRNFYIEAEEGVMLGTWHVLPTSLKMDSAAAMATEADPNVYELALRKGLPIILYMHGNSGSRAAYHRVELYQVLRDVDAHVIAFDYRGYGDSSPVAVSEEAIVRDGKAVYKWLRKRSGNSPIYVWGHSLGTGVSSRAVSELCQEGEPPKGLILEAPFNNMSEEIFSHPLSKLFRLAPWYRWAAVGALHSKNILFESDKHVSGVTVPIVILHAEDDNIIPVKLGRKLYQAAVDSRPKSVASSLIVFDGNLGYGHRYICRDPKLPIYIRRFLKHPEAKLD